MSQCRLLRVGMGHCLGFACSYNSFFAKVKAHWEVRAASQRQCRERAMPCPGSEPFPSATRSIVWS